MSADEQQYLKLFDGIRRLYGNEKFALLRELHICVIGVGGVGSWVVEALARTAIGRLTIIDNDTVSLSNMNRQLHTLQSTVDRSKVEVMQARVLEINPWCEVNVIDDFLTMKTLPDYLDPGRGYDYVIDAIDSIKFKSAMIAHCKRNKIPMIMTGGAGGLTDPTLIQIADLTKTFNDPLAAKVRSQLRSDYGFTRNPKRRFGVECVFSSQQQVYPKDDGSVSHEKPGIHGVSLDCRFGYGSASFVTGSFAYFAAARAIEKALERRLKKTPI
ncbi:MAG: tRNA cyclic N6-threonylcarbamoyladenosine(37) synthase TcdA [Gammaproteobacteria bacterium]|nr:tRNA cyclic N6-threonylcarbamoyladenosine(37) synthase TcdA [Gammaproteobacteria bacterium]